MIPKIHPEARLEMREAARYYQQFSEQLPGRLREELNQAISNAVENPRHFPILENDWRKIRLHRFPFGLIYGKSGNELQVIAFAHHKRVPGYWKKRSLTE